jgi:dephospho-CoA kinase
MKMAKKYTDPLLIAITGGTGCGQTAAAKFFEKFGAKVIHADQLAHQVLERDREVRSLIRNELGNQYFFRNGRVNRKLLGEAVFKDERKLQILNSIVHPKLAEKLVEEIEAARESGKYPMIVVDAALVYEAQMEHLFDAIVVITSSQKLRIERLVNRDKISKELAKQRIEKQISIRDKINWADYVIHNNNTLEELERRCRNVYQKILKDQKKLLKSA